jgi:glycosyltransferase involved in cell wall biosynthesis
MGKMKILYCCSIMHRGGMEALMMNYVSHLDHDRFQVDFLEQGYGKGVFDSEIEKYGGKVFYIHTPKTHYLAYKKQALAILNQGGYSIVHAHMEASSFFILKLAKQCKIPVRIAHAHSTGYYEAASWWKKIVYSFCKRRLSRVATAEFACSKAAGNWLFGKKAGFVIIPNAVDFQKFIFDGSKRSEIRNEYEVPSNAFVIGHIGRFMIKEKNQPFLIDCFNSFQRIHPNSFLFLVGGGKDRHLIEEKIQNVQCQNVIIVDNVSNAPDYYSAFDLFCLPSLFEGFPVVLTEATANGLPCLVSDHVTPETNIAGNISYLPINQGTECWLESFQKMMSVTRQDNIPAATKAGFEINSASKRLESQYSQLIESSKNE